jgi:hypothetical protein
MERCAVGAPQDRFRLAYVRLAHHPLLRDLASVSTAPDLVAAGRRVRQTCHPISPPGAINPLLARRSPDCWPGPGSCWMAEPIALELGRRANIKLAALSPRQG